MRQFALRQFGGGTGSTVLPEGNLSLFENSESVALDSYYQQNGVNAKYTRKANGSQSSIRIVIVERRESETQENSRVVNVEMLTCLVRRYNGVAMPAEGDLIALESPGGVTRKYMLTQRPVKAISQLEWEVEFSRTRPSRQGGVNAILRGQ